MTNLLLAIQFSKRVSTCQPLHHFNTKTIKNKVSTCHQFNAAYKSKSDQQLQMFSVSVSLSLTNWSTLGASAYFIHFLSYFSTKILTP